MTLNIHSAKALNSVAGHEITHVLEGTELYDSLREAVFAYAESKGELGKRRSDLEKLYANVKGADIDGELTADLVGDYIFTDADFVRQLHAVDRNVFQKVFDEIKYLCKLATAGSKEARQLEKAKKLFEDVYREASVEKSTTQEGGVRYSLMAFEKDGRRFVEIDQDQDKFDGRSADEFPGIAKEIIKEKFENKVVGVDNKMFVNGAGRNEFVYPSKPIKDAAVYEAKMRASSELDNLLDAGTNLRTEADGKDGHVHLDAVGGFDHFDTLFKIGKDILKPESILKTSRGGSCLRT